MNKTNGSPTSIVTSNSTLCNYEKKDMFTKLDILEYKEQYVEKKNPGSNPECIRIETVFRK